MILAIIVICGAGLTGWYVWHSSQSKTTNQNSTSAKSSTSPYQTGVTPGPGSNWNTYTNKTLGFSIQIPKEAYATLGGECRYDTSERSYYANGGVVPVGIFEDGDNFWVDGLYSYQLTDEHDSQSAAATFSGCQKVETTAKFIEQALQSPPSSTYEDFALPFSVVPVNNRAGIDTWVTSKFGSGVYVTSLTANASGWQDVNLGCKNPGALGSCIGYSYRLRYYQAKQRLVYLEYGQAAHLMTPNNQSSYDPLIFDSFKLL